MSESVGGRSGDEGSGHGRSPDPPACIIIGMAGSGKTTLMQQIAASLSSSRTPAYLLNLDPAVLNVPYRANIDIRDSIKYKNVMEQYRLGPNGGILTCLNLFAAQFQTVLELAEKRRNQFKYMFVDTPGQIEVFTWSASGSIITESLATTFPTCVLFVVDTVRCKSPMTFVSNMMYACSILYKTRLPLVVVFNKIDAEKHDFAVSWMEDYAVFDEVLREESTFADSLARSMAITLEELYKNIHSVGVSAITGEGMDDLFAVIRTAAKEYHESYRPDLEARTRKRAEEEQTSAEEAYKAFQQDRDKNESRSTPVDTMWAPEEDDEGEPGKNRLYRQSPNRKA
uniref:GPN-loop GTPase n=1 Tax=Rhodosorus marinus TaxID=101924 RepID=A0A7S2ZPY7_9RHOD|mmetsp:Transcript_24802/g.98031  ORF Transcript_24802/g.98031 Transcript_24802/m.98031 type:complete len:341 (+) Transcript_24802:297-1319(+)